MTIQPLGNTSIKGCSLFTFSMRTIFIFKREARSMRNKYSDYTPSTAKYMLSVEKYLKSKYGMVNEEWFQPLIMLADNLDVFNLCKQSIKKDGLMMIAKNGAPCKNPLIKVQLDAQVQIQKLLSEFGLTPKAQAKLNLPTDDEDELKQLMGIE